MRPTTDAWRILWLKASYRHLMNYIHILHNENHELRARVQKELWAIRH